MKMNLPNKLTVLRILMVPLYLLVFMCEFPLHYLLSCLIFVAAALTDLIDGKIARDQHLVTNLGKFLDPIADKVLTTAAFVGILAAAGGEFAWIWAWCLVVILAREFVVATIRMMAASGGEVVAADLWGKVKTVMQYVVIVYMLLMLEVFSWGVITVTGVLIALQVFGLLLMIVTTVATVISGVRYVKQNWHFVKEDE